jgi:hypothetical protein
MGDMAQIILKQMPVLDAFVAFLGTGTINQKYESTQYSFLTGYELRSVST